MEEAPTSERPPKCQIEATTIVMVKEGQEDAFYMS